MRTSVWNIGFENNFEGEPQLHIPQENWIG
jgi:hypothetical protein